MSVCENCPEKRQCVGDILRNEKSVAELRAATAQIQAIKAMNDLSVEAYRQVYEDGDPHYVRFVEDVAGSLVEMCDGQIDAVLERNDQLRERLSRLGERGCRGAIIVESPDGAEMWECPVKVDVLSP